MTPLVAITGRKADEEIRFETTARLVPEPDNPHDPNAIAVHVDGRLVGYLGRDENRRWLDVIPQDAVVACEAMIAGRPGGGTSNLGVFLRLPTPTEARAQIGIHLRGNS